MMRLIIPKTLTLVLLLAAGALRAAEAPATAASDSAADDSAGAGEAAAKFFDAVKRRDVKAIGQLIDAESWARRGFGQELSKSSAAELAEAYPAMTRYIGYLLAERGALPVLISRMDKPVVRSLRDGSTVVDVQHYRQSGERERWQLPMNRGPRGWLIEDMISSGATIAQTMGAMYGRRATAQLTPAQWMAEQAKTADAELERMKAVRAAGAVKPLEKPKLETPQITFQAYLELLKAGKTAEAIATFWDMEKLFSHAFENSLRAMPTEARQEMSEMLIGLKVPALGHRELIDAAASATFADLRTTDSTDTSATVTAKLTTADGGKLTIRAYFFKEGEAWKIWDIQSRGASMGDQLRRMFLRMRDSQTPLELIRMMAIGQDSEPPSGSGGVRSEGVNRR